MADSIKSKPDSNRNVSIELLRVLAMILIIFQHFMEYGGIKEGVILGDLMYPFVFYLYGLVQIAVNCYVLISGYFLVTSKFKLSKIIVLWIEVVFYSLFLYLLMVALGYYDFSIVTFISCFVPLITGRYWFFTIYFGMYLLFPFLNIAVYAMSKRQLRNLIVVLLALFSLWTTLPFFKGMNVNGGWSIAWFVVLYFIAAYLRLYYIPNYKLGRKLILTFILSLVLPMSKFALDLCERKGIPFVQGKTTMLFKYESIFVVLLTISVFVLFLNIQIQPKGIGMLILKISPCTFAVYLIHHHAKVYPIMWDIIDGTRFLDNWWFPFYMTLVVLSIFAICTGIEKLRSIIFIPVVKGKCLYKFSEFCERSLRTAIDRLEISVKKL